MYLINLKPNQSSFQFYKINAYTRDLLSVYTFLVYRQTNASIYLIHICLNLCMNIDVDAKASVSL